MTARVPPPIRRIPAAARVALALLPADFAAGVRSLYRGALESEATARRDPTDHNLTIAALRIGAYHNALARLESTYLDAPAQAYAPTR